MFQKKQIEEGFKSIIGFNIATTVSNHKNQSGFKPKIIELNWFLKIYQIPIKNYQFFLRIAYDIEKQIVEDEWQFFVKPQQTEILNEETIQFTNIKSINIQTAPALFDVIQQFNDFVYTKYLQENKDFCLIVCKNEILTDILPQQCKEQEIKIASYFRKYFNIFDEYKVCYPGTKNLTSLEQMLTFLNLQDMSAETCCQKDCKSIIRLVNMMVKTNYKFTNPESVIEKIEPAVPIIRRERERELSGEMGGRNQCFYVRMRGLPFNTREKEILEFFKNIEIKRECIAFQYDHDGRFSGEAYVKLFSDNDWKQAMLMNMKEIGSRYIELFQSSEKEFNRAKQSQLCEDSNDNQLNTQFPINEFTGILKLRGLPFHCTDHEIAEFFQEFLLVEAGIYRGFTNGRPSGEAYVLFQNKNDADKAHALLNMQKIGHRYIELFSATAKEFRLFMNKQANTAKINQNYYYADKQPENQLPYQQQDPFGQQFNFSQPNNLMQFPNSVQYPNPVQFPNQFMMPNYFVDPQMQYQLIDQQKPIFNYYQQEESQQPAAGLTKSGKTVQMLPKIPTHKKKCTLILFGLPFNVVKKEIIAFFKGFEIQQHDIFMMSNPKFIYNHFFHIVILSGKFNGKATVMFESQEEADRALKTRNMEYLRDRYIEIFEYK